MKLRVRIVEAREKAVVGPGNTASQIDPQIDSSVTFKEG